MKKIICGLLFGLVGVGAIAEEHLDLVDTSNGSLNLKYTDFDIPARGVNLNFIRFYNSQSDYNGSLGWGWQTPWDITLEYRPDEKREVLFYSTQGLEKGAQKADEKVQIIAGGSAPWQFIRKGDEFVSIHGDAVRVKKSGPDFIMTFKDGTGYHFGKTIESEEVKRPMNYQRIRKGHLVVMSLFSVSGNRGVYKLSKIKDRFGNETNFTYNSNNQLIMITDPAGRRLIFTYTPKAKIASVTDPIGRKVTFNYDYNDNLIKAIDPLGRATYFSYDSDHHITKITRPNKAVVKITYDRNRRVVRLIGPSQEDTFFSYPPTGGESGMTTVITDGLGNRITHSYQPGYYDYGPKTLIITDAEGNKTIKYRNARKQIIKIIYPNGAVWNYTYDDRGNLTQRSGPEEVVWRYEWESIYNRLIKITDPNKYTTNLTYNDNNNTLKIDYPDGGSTTITYNQHGEIKEIVDPEGRKTTYEYNGYGQPMKATLPDNITTTSFSYDSVSRLTSFTNPRGKTVNLSYDGANRVIEIKDAVGNLTKYAYDHQDNMTSITDPLNRTIQFEYDASNRIIQVVGQTNQKTEYTYDKIGNLIFFKDSEGSIFSSSWDRNRRIKSQTDPLGGKIRYEYDSVGNLTRLTDSEGNSIGYSYDLLNRLCEVRNTEWRITRFGYDRIGNLLSITNAKNHTISYQYDPLDRPIEEKDALGNTIVYKYDKVGNLIEKKDARGSITTYTYDDLDNMSKILYPDNSELSMNYNENGNLSSFSHPSLSGSLIYDDLDRLIALTYKYGSFEKKIEYTYDALNNLKTLTNPEGDVISYAYNNLNRITSIANPDGAASYSYDTLGRRRKMTLPNGVTTEYTYDKLSRITSIIHKGPAGTIISSYSYTYDDVGNILSMTTSKGTYRYEYDNFYRLTKETTPEGTITTYTYDSVGNRLTMNNTTYTYDEADRLITIHNPQLTINNSYDKNGNLITKSDGVQTTTYTYDYGNRLVRIMGPNGTATYIYSPLGYRIRRIIAPGTITYLWSPQRLIGEYNDSGNPISVYTPGPGIDEPVSMKMGTLTAYFQGDLLGSIIGLSDAGGNQIASYSYEPFGRIRSQAGIDTSLLFTGRELDLESGFYYLRHRHYDPERGRFLQREPMKYLYSAFYGENQYSYVANNPLRFVDPKGLDKTTFSMGGGATYGRQYGYSAGWESVDGSLPRPTKSRPRGTPQAGVSIDAMTSEWFGKDYKKASVGIGYFNVHMPSTYAYAGKDNYVHIPNGVGVGVGKTVLPANVSVEDLSPEPTHDQIVYELFGECKDWTPEQRYENADRIRTSGNRNFFQQLGARNRQLELATEAAGGKW